MAGPVTNVDLLHQIMYHPQFVRGAYDTSFIDQNLDTLVAWSAGVEPEEAEAAAGSTAEPAEKAPAADEAPAAAGDGTAAEPAAPATPVATEKEA